MMIPKRLKKGDTIGMVAPSKPLEEDHKLYLENFKKKMEDMGFNIVYGKNIFESNLFGVAAGTPEQRAEDINSMIKDPKIDAVWCIQGGSPSSQTLDLLDYDSIAKNPKLFLGKSDVDVLLMSINKMTGLVTVHCCDSKIGNGKEFDYEYTQKWFQERLINGKKEIEPAYEWKCLREGKAEGKIIGCNLKAILKIAGTKYFPDFNDSILFLESHKVAAKELVCRMTQLKQLGVLDKIKGIVIGHIFQFDERREGFDYEDVILEMVKDYDFPVLKIEEFGHYHPHAFLPIGCKVRLDATNKTLEIIKDFVE